jgi:NAD(P)-dependent dehydrogenase (short-subunit alcohol dehydrogenase family)
MDNMYPGSKTILITGGTSGLGYELVRLLLNKGFYIVTTGRQSISIPEYAHRFKLYIVDFSDLKQVSETVRAICSQYDFDIIINNAAVIGPPDYVATKDNFEYTFQVNFLSHLLINEIIINSIAKRSGLIIMAITSLAYRLARIDMMSLLKESDYTAIKAYSYSKLFLTLMCKNLPARYPEHNLKCISFDPGIFRSGIYRMQKNWFRLLYQIAAPFMRNPDKVAEIITGLLLGDNTRNGVIIDCRKRFRELPVISDMLEKTFWSECYEKIIPFLIQ